MDVGARIKSLREAAGLSQNELARRAGVSQSGLSYIESGEKSPSVDTLLRIADALGVTVSELLNAQGDTEMPPHIRALVREARSLTPEQAEMLARFIRTMKSR